MDCGAKGQPIQRKATRAEVTDHLSFLSQRASFISLAVKRKVSFPRFTREWVRGVRAAMSSIDIASCPEGYLWSDI